MNLYSVREQIEDITCRLISVSLCVAQFTPSVKVGRNGERYLGLKGSQSIALKNISYETIYREIDLNNAYHIKLIDGGLLSFEYAFDSSDKLTAHRLAYFPCPALPSVDEAPELYQFDELYADILLKQIVRFPIRFDYNPRQQRNIRHPASHLTLGQYENCRIPVSGPVAPASFGMFIVRNFYGGAYIRNKNCFDKKPFRSPKFLTISSAEQGVTHIVQGL